MYVCDNRVECEPLTSHALKTVSASPYISPSLSPTLPLSFTPSLALSPSFPPSLPFSLPLSLPLSLSPSLPLSLSPSFPPSLALFLFPSLSFSLSLSLPLSLSPMCHSYQAKQQKISLQSEAEYPSLPWPPEEPQGLEPPNTQDASSFSLPVHCGDCISDIEFSLFWRVKQQPPKASP